MSGFQIVLREWVKTDQAFVVIGHSGGDSDALIIQDASPDRLPKSLSKFMTSAEGLTCINGNLNSPVFSSLPIHHSWKSRTIVQPSQMIIKNSKDGYLQREQEDSCSSLIGTRFV